MTTPHNAYKDNGGKNHRKRLIVFFLHEGFSCTIEPEGEDSVEVLFTKDRTSIRLSDEAQITRISSILEEVILDYQNAKSIGLLAEEQEERIKKDFRNLFDQTLGNSE